MRRLPDMTKKMAGVICLISIVLLSLVLGAVAWAYLLG